MFILQQIDEASTPKHKLQTKKKPTFQAPHHCLFHSLPIFPQKCVFVGNSESARQYVINKMDKLQSEGGQMPPLNIIIVEQSEESDLHNPFAKLRKYSANLFNQEPFEDDQFKLPQEKLPKGVVRKRLRDIYAKDTHIAQGQQESDNQLRGDLPTPTYLAQMRMLPEWHFLTLIQPRNISEQGYYHVAVVQGGRIAKLVIDDSVYFDEIAQQIHAHPYLPDKPWVHIILKAWAKLNKGYDKLDSCPPFAFIRAFSFPDWAIFNPGFEDLETVISRIGPTNRKDYFYVCHTKEDRRVGQFGLIPNCAAYIITGYHQEYANVYLKLRSFAGDRWNGRTAQKDYERPTQHISLSAGEFIVPLKTFINVFHLIYYTTNKYTRRIPLHYNKYTISLDARQSKATFITFELLGEGVAERQTSINFYFPSVKASDYGNPKNAQNEAFPPSVKICIGRCIQQVNLEGSYSYAESLRQNILKNEQGYFLNPANSRYQHVVSDYFSGYANEATYHLKLRPGKYIIRLKVQKLLPEYRALLNVTSTDDTSFSQCKLTKRQQTTFLSQVLSSRARREQKNVIHPFPHKKQSWIMANDDFDTLGYGTITFQSGKKDGIVMTIAIDIKKLKLCGYRIKNKLQLGELSNEMRLKEGQSVILILKKDLQFKGECMWPPQGISISYQHITTPKKHKKIA